MAARTSSMVAEAVTRANARLPDYARIRRWAVVPDPFTFANGMLTANGRRICRNQTR